jgi:TonB family protein
VLKKLDHERILKIENKAWNSGENPGKFLYCLMKFIFFISCCFSLLTAAGQDKNQFYALDAHMNQTVLDSSKYILWIHEKDSAKWQWDYYLTWGPLVKSTTYADHDGTLLNGRFCLYNNFGNLDSTGVFDRGKKNGSFIKFRSLNKDSIEFFRQYEYQQDSLVGTTNTLDQKDRAGQSDSSRSREPEYPGGDSAWRSYLVKSMRYPDRALNKNIQGRVRICFLVDTEGQATDPFIEKSVEYALDQESLKLIKNAGLWIPGRQNGIPAKTYKIQPFSYILESR